MQPYCFTESDRDAGSIRFGLNAKTASSGENESQFGSVLDFRVTITIFDCRADGTLASDVDPRRAAEMRVHLLITLCTIYFRIILCLRSDRKVSRQQFLTNLSCLRFFLAAWSLSYGPVLPLVPRRVASCLAVGRTCGFVQRCRIGLKLAAPLRYTIGFHTPLYNLLFKPK